MSIRNIHCVDMSDELVIYCRQYNHYQDLRSWTKPPFIVDMDIIGRYRTRFLHFCPESHFQCPGDGLCLPYYMRCNSVPDCVGHVDEHDCETHTCPGYYKCWKSQVCLCKMSGKHIGMSITVESPSDET